MNQDLYEVTFEFPHPGDEDLHGLARYSFNMYAATKTRAIVESTKTFMRAYPDLDPRDAFDIKVEVFK